VQHLGVRQDRGDRVESRPFGDDDEMQGVGRPGRWRRHAGLEQVVQHRRRNVLVQVLPYAATGEDKVKPGVHPAIPLELETYRFVTATALSPVRHDRQWYNQPQTSQKQGSSDYSVRRVVKGIFFHFEEFHNV